MDIYFIGILIICILFGISYRYYSIYTGNIGSNVIGRYIVVNYLGILQLLVDSITSTFITYRLEYYIVISRVPTQELTAKAKIFINYSSIS